MGYLLSIELREGNSIEQRVGEILVLEQAWCESIRDVVIEADGRNHLTAARFGHALDAAFKTGVASGVRTSVTSDPRLPAPNILIDEGGR